MLGSYNRRQPFKLLNVHIQATNGLVNVLHGYGRLIHPFMLRGGTVADGLPAVASFGRLLLVLAFLPLLLNLL